MKLKMNSGRKGNSSYTFSPLSLVTMDFGRLQPVLCHSVTLGDKFSDVQGRGLLRCTPQVFPPFGRMNLKSAAFFVPDSQLFSWSSAFHSDNQNWRGQLADKTPSFDQYLLNSIFANNDITGLTTLVVDNPSAEPALNTFDLVFPSNTGRALGKTNLAYYKLTPLGWKFYAIFKSLGYDFVIYPINSTGTLLTRNQHRDNYSTVVSALPYLAYCKIWNDFFCNSYQSDNNVVSEYLQNIYLNKTVTISGYTAYNSQTMMLASSIIVAMLIELQVPYESNMYTNAWNHPNDPTGLENAKLNQVNTQSLISPFGSGNEGEFASLSVNPNRTTHEDATGGATAVFSQLGHRTLQAFDKFVRRRNLAGSKAVQQLYALFGALPGEWSKDYVVKLSENSSRVNFSAITSQSDTTNGANGKPLGAFAGTGLGGFDISYSYDSDTFGTIVVVSWLNIDPVIMHGLSPDVLRIKPLDYYSPDFDGNAYRPIPYCEVTGAKSLGKDGYSPVTIFGYTNMYDDYRMMRDVVAGNFLDDTTRHFAFMRDLSETRRNMAAFNLDMHPQTEDVQYWHIDGNSDLTNPFITGASLGDRFWFCIDWQIKCTRPILSNENSFNLDGEGSLVINKNGDGMA